MVLEMTGKITTIGPLTVSLMGVDGLPRLGGQGEEERKESFHQDTENSECVFHSRRRKIMGDADHGRRIGHGQEGT